MHSQSKQTRERDKQESGFTLVEVVVSAAIFTIVMGAVYGLLEVARAGRLNTTQRTDVLQNVRVSLNAMGRDAINAGVGYPNLGALIPDDKLALIGIAADGDTDPEFLTPVYAGNNLNPVNGRMTDQVTFLYVDDAFNSGSSVPIGAIADPSGSATVMTIPPGFDNTAPNIGDIFLLTGNNGSAIGTLTGKTGTNTLNFANTDPLGVNNPGGGSPLDNIVPPASLLRLNWVTYYVGSDDGSGMGTGALRRRVFGGLNTTNNTLVNWADQPLAFGVEDMQIQYVLRNGDIVDAPVTAQMEDIRQVRVSVTVRSPDINPKTNEPFRHTMTASFSTRNLVYEKL